MSKPLYRALAGLVAARENCIRDHKQEWRDRHEETADKLVKEFLPSGSGFDSGTKLDWGASTGEKLAFTTSFHHMNDGGMYDGWTEHVVTVTPSLLHTYMVKVSGRDRNDIKEYIGEEFQYALEKDVEWAMLAPYVTVEITHVENEYAVVNVTTLEGRPSYETLATCADVEKAEAFAVEYCREHRDAVRKVEVSA